METSNGNLEWKPRMEKAGSFIVSSRKFKVETVNNLITSNLKK